MDEPTSSLTAKEIDDLFRIIRKLRDEGRGIVYISHRLEELSHIVDRVTIMRDGQYITDGNFKDMDMDYIIKNMVGREIKEKFPRVECRKDPGGTDPSGKRRTWAEPAVRREYPCMVRADVEPGTVPADGCKAVEAGTGIRDSFRDTYRD